MNLIEIRKDHCYIHCYELSKFLDLNNNDGLFKPSTSVYKITKTTESRQIQMQTNNKFAY